MPQLTREQYLATLGEHPTPVAWGATSPLDFWAYVDDIPTTELGGNEFSSGEVSRAWETVQGTWQHVLIAGTEPNIHLVIVLALAPPAVVGHYVLDLNEEYGLDKP